MGKDTGTATLMMITTHDYDDDDDDDDDDDGYRGPCYRGCILQSFA